MRWSGRPRLQRERLHTPDGDFLDLDWHDAPGRGALLVLILHGLEGSSRSHYASGLLREASAHGLRASAFKVAYVAAKHGLVGLTKTVALECAEAGITCNAICPGYVLTPLVENQIDDQARAHKLPRDRVVREVILAKQPTKQFVQVDEVAALAVFLASDAARSITGSAYPIDGGWTAE